MRNYNLNINIAGFLFSSLAVIFLIFGAETVFGATVKKPRVALFGAPSSTVPGPIVDDIRDALEEFVSNRKDVILVETGKLDELFKTFGINKPSVENALNSAKKLSSDLLLVYIIDKDEDVEGGFRLTFNLCKVNDGSILREQSADFTEPEMKQRIEELGTNMFVERKLDSGLFLSIQLVCLIPTSGLGDTVNSPGLGVSARFGVENLLISYLEFGLETGYFQFFYQQNPNDSIIQVPFLLYTGYKIHFFDQFFITPLAGCGIDLIITSHGDEKGFYQEDNSQNIGLQECLKAGFEIGWIVSESTSLVTGVSYSLVFEEKKLDFININLGLVIIL